ncbi:MAG: hypothetical protein GXY20_01165 [Clostridiales bacterium]|nr:hypothetical protein [Clostridiales bacterium]
MTKRIRLKYIKVLLPLVLFMLIVGVMLLALTDFGFVNLFKEAKHLSDLDTDDMMGAFAYADITEMLGDFAGVGEYDESTGKISSYRERYCIFMSGDDFVAVNVRGKANLTNVSQYVAALEEYSREELEGLNIGSVYGTVGEMDDEIYDYFCGWILNSFEDGSAPVESLDAIVQSESFDAELYVAQHATRYILNTGYYGSVSKGLMIVLTLFALLLVIAAAALAVVILSGALERPLRALKADIGTDRADEDYDSGREIGPVRISPKHVWIFGKLITDIVKTTDIVWAYARSRRLEGGRLYWMLVMKTADKKEYVAGMGDPKTVQEALHELEEKNQTLSIGFDKEKQRLYEKDIQGFIGRARKERKEKTAREAEGRASEISVAVTEEAQAPAPDSLPDDPAAV